MRDRLAVFASMSTICLLLAMSPHSQAQQQDQQPAGAANQNPTAGQNRNQDIRRERDDPRGDRGRHRRRRGDARLPDQPGGRGRRPRSSPSSARRSRPKVPKRRGRTTGSNEDRARRTESGTTSTSCGSRLAPRSARAHAKGEKTAAAGETERSGQKRELALDNLEVGDHVEIQFTKNDDSGSTGSAHQTEQMRRKHGRHRTHVGFASEITILPDSGSHDATAGTAERATSQ